MGMFDYLVCDAPLPDGFQTSGRFQTKDTPTQALDLYRITDEGLLERRTVETEWTEDDGALLGGYYREIEGTEGWEEVPFHGDIEFYASNVSALGPGSVVTDDGKPPQSRSYTARFTNDRLAIITGGVEPDGYEGFVLMTSEEFHAQSRRESDDGGAGKRTPRPTPIDRVSLFADGIVDEVVARGVDVHLEHLDDGTWYLGIGEHQFYLGGPGGCACPDIGRLRSAAREVEERDEPFLSPEEQLELKLLELFGDDATRGAWLYEPQEKLGMRTPAEVMEAEGAAGYLRVVDLISELQTDYDG